MAVVARRTERISWATCRVATLAIACLLLVAGGARGARLTWSGPTVVDTAASDESFGALACPTSTLCVAADQQGGVATTTDPGLSATWTVSRLTPYASLTTFNQIVGLACPSATLCVGVDSQGDVFSTTAPTGGLGAWHQIVLPTADSESAVACPTTTLCVTPSNDSADVFTTTDPTGAASAWARTTIPAGNDNQAAISCPTAALCLIGAGDGLVLTSTDPAGGGSTYVAHRLISSGTNAPPGITAVSCPTVTLCVAGDDNGDVFATTDPTAASPAWTMATIDKGTEIAALDCRPSGLCVADDENGLLLASAAAGSAAPVWSRVADDDIEYGPYEGAATFAVACPTDTLCLAVDGSPVMPRSTDPAAKGSWQLTQPATDIGPVLTGLSCPSLRLCVAVDDDGNAVWSATPEVASSWQHAQIDTSSGLTGVSCPTRKFCAAVDTPGDVVLSTAPTEGLRGWRLHLIENVLDGGNGIPMGLNGVSCASAHFCMTGDANPGDVLTASNPWGGVTAWLHHGIDGPGDGLYAASCPTAGFCGVVDASGDVDAFSPGGGAHFTDVSLADGLDAISCPSKRLCAVAAGGIADNTTGGGVWTSRNPAAARPHWRHVLSDASAEPAVACHGTAICVAVDVNGAAAVSFDPAAAHPVWRTEAVDPNAVFSAASCPTSTVCLVADRAGQIWVARRA
jgi:hypothetical protein